MPAVRCHAEPSRALPAVPRIARPGHAQPCLQFHVMPCRLESLSYLGSINAGNFHCLLFNRRQRTVE
jgi:hypothetical protein